MWDLQCEWQTYVDQKRQSPQFYSFSHLESRCYFKEAEMSVKKSALNRKACRSLNNREAFELKHEELNIWQAQLKFGYWIKWEIEFLTCRYCNEKKLREAFVFVTFHFLFLINYFCSWCKPSFFIQIFFFAMMYDCGHFQDSQLLHQSEIDQS